MVAVQEYLEVTLGLDLTGWTLERDCYVSDGGLTLSGWGVSANGNEAWMAIVPEPGSALLLGMGLLGLAGSRRAHRSSS